MKRLFASLILLLGLATVMPVYAATQSGSSGLEATIKGNPPTQAPTINSPSNGQTFSKLPITVSGLCQSGLLVEVFKNNVFAGSAVCSGGSYSMQIDLFAGKNDLVARQYDDLNQQSPDSAIVSVTFNNALPSTGALVSITSQYAKRGADPGSELTWPITISGGDGPYAISVDWGDKTNPDLISQQFAGNYTLKHIYKVAGVYNVTIKVTDKNGNSAYLQVVGIGNGPIAQTNSSNNKQSVIIIREVPLWALLILASLSILSFWIGKKHQVQTIRARLRAGKPPFG